MIKKEEKEREKTEREKDKKKCNPLYIEPLILKKINA